MPQSGPALKKTLSALAAGVVLAGVTPLSLRAADRAKGPAETPCPTSADDTVAVVDVDERLALTLADGRIVRLAGLEAPRATTQAPRRPREIAARLLARLQEEPVTLADLGTRDRWGTTPVRAFVGGENVASDLLGDGLARFAPEPAVHACRASMLAAEAGARAAGRGVWADPELAVRSAETLAEASPSGGAITGLAVVEGSVVAVGDTATRLFLNLGRNRGGFAISASKRNTALMDSPVMQEARKVGARLRVRGLLDAGGLRMDLSDADALEVLPGLAAVGTSGRE